MWWLDEHTTRLLIDFIGLGDEITVSVDPGPPRVLPREQVGFGLWYDARMLIADHLWGSVIRLHAGAGTADALQQQGLQPMLA